MDCMQFRRLAYEWRNPLVSIPQAVWIACNTSACVESVLPFHVSIPQAVWIACNRRCKDFPNQYAGRFNTASGMDCMQFEAERLEKSLLMFPYRKRYGLHAIFRAYAGRRELSVSIPQAVWIACNTVPHSPWDS